MGGASRRVYPKANTTAQWYETLFSRGDFPRIEKILLHTTETTGWPGYKAGASAPTLTYHPRLRAWRQHNYLDRSARALVDPDWTPVRENRDNVIQIEIICYSDEKLAATVGGLPVSKLTDDQLKDLGDFIGWVRAQWGGPPLAFPPRSNSRMTSAQYDAWQGLCGHDDASGNTHWDPGALNFSRIIQHAKAYGTTTAPTPTPAPVEDDMTPAELAAALDPVTGNQALRRNLGAAMWGYKNTGVDPDDAFQNLIDLTRASIDVEALASSIVAKLPAGAAGDLTADDVRVASEEALRNVLGAVDDEPSAT